MEADTDANVQRIVEANVRNTLMLPGKMTWTITLSLKDVNDDPVEGAELRMSTWTGGGSVKHEAPVKIPASSSFVVDDAVINIIFDLRHPRFATLVLVLVRTQGENVWLWIDPASQVMTLGRNVTVNAVLGRVRPAPLQYIPEDKLNKYASDIKAVADVKAAEKNPSNYLFNWDEVPGKDSERLRKFLKQKFGISWVKTAKIEKIYNNIITVSTGNNLLSLTFEKTKVKLKIGDGRTDELIVIMTKNGKRNIWDRSKIPFFAPMNKNPHAVLITKQRTYRFPVQKTEPKFHVLGSGLLGDNSKQGWDRFQFWIKEVILEKYSRLYLVEYGEVGTDGPHGPRFLIGLWVPNACTKVGITHMDFLVWLHPNTTPEVYPYDEYPFIHKYPYELWAENYPPDVYATQRYVDLPLHHLYSQHYLAYQMSAAGRAAVIVIPVVPTSHFEAFTSRPTLMRLLNELCLWIPRFADDKGLPKLSPPRPLVGRVGVAGFSASVLRLQTLMDTDTPFPDYGENIWLSKATEFDDVWGELWAIDGNFGGLKNFSTFLNKAAGWIQARANRRLRIYKNEYTDGRWDPRNEGGGTTFGKLIQGVTPVERGEWKGAIWAISIADPSGKWHVASFSKKYVLDESGSKDVQIPSLVEKPDEGPHEKMPRLMFGHAAITSAFAHS